MTSKRLSEDAWTALDEALSTFQWFKRPFESMVRAHFASAPELLAQLNFTDPKRVVVGQLVSLLRLRESRYQTLVVDTLVALSQTDSTFGHLARLEDGVLKREHAAHALRAVQRVAQKHSDLVAERERVRREAQQRHAARADVRARVRRLTDLLQDFLEMYKETNPHARGHALEGFLRELFELWDLNPRAAFNVEHEQIDGAFTLRTDDYLLEAKWWAQPIGPSELNNFKAKVDGKARNTLGLLVAINGFTEGAITLHSRAQTPLVLMDGQDLMPILEGRLDLEEVLNAKRRHAAETGCPMFRVIP